jgi:hypothetical protein
MWLECGGRRHHGSAGDSSALLCHQQLLAHKVMLRRLSWLVDGGEGGGAWHGQSVKGGIILGCL